jgi:hypothetical protein
MVKHFSKVAEYLLSAEKIWIVDKTVTKKNCPVIKRGDQKNYYIRQKLRKQRRRKKP